MARPAREPRRDPPLLGRRLLDLDARSVPRASTSTTRRSRPRCGSTGAAGASRRWNDTLHLLGREPTHVDEAEGGRWPSELSPPARLVRRPHRRTASQTSGQRSGGARSRACGRPRASAGGRSTTARPCRRRPCGSGSAGSAAAPRASRRTRRSVSDGRGPTPARPAALGELAPGSVPGGGSRHRRWRMLIRTHSAMSPPSARTAMTSAFTPA